MGNIESQTIITKYWTTSKYRKPKIKADNTQVYPNFDMSEHPTIQPTTITSTTTLRTANGTLHLPNHNLLLLPCSLTSPDYHRHDVKVEPPLPKMVSL